MPADTDTGDFDDQDSAEAFDEEATGELATDAGKDVLDVTTALGDGDVDGDQDALDADEEDDDDLEEIGEVSYQEEADDLQGTRSDNDPLAVDDIADFTSDRDGLDDDEVDGVSARPSEDAELISMGDVDALGGAQATSLADLESDSLSDSDLVELDYKES